MKPRKSLKTDKSSSIDGGGFFDNQILSLQEAADYLTVSYKTARKYAESGMIPNQRIGNRYKFLRSELDKFLRGE